jgi:hypothetical protein
MRVALRLALRKGRPEASAETAAGGDTEGDKCAPETGGGQNDPQKSAKINKPSKQA